MVKKAFTLIEVIYVVAILAFILVGGFQAIAKFYKKVYITKVITNLEFNSQILLDQISKIIYHKVPLSMIRYNQNTNDFKYIEEIKENEKYPILEWIGYLNEAMVELNLSGFVDLNESKKPTIKTIDFNTQFINNILKNKFKSHKSFIELSAIIFAGSFDRGDENALVDYNNSFGWHENEARLVYKIDKYNQIDNDCNLTLKNSNESKIKNATIYEKFYLVDTAYAIALKKDLNINKWKCDISFNKFKDNDLLLFYNYRPWRNETFCGDGGDGDVTLLSSNIKSFSVKKINSYLEFKVLMFKVKGDINITISKKRVIF